MVSEMIHTVSLIHDDVIDGAHTRRKKTSVNKAFGDKACVLAGDYILSCASQALAELGNTQVVELLAQVVDDLIRGKFSPSLLCMQLKLLQKRSIEKHANMTKLQYWCSALTNWVMKLQLR